MHVRGIQHALSLVLHARTWTNAHYTLQQGSRKDKTKKKKKTKTGDDTMVKHELTFHNMCPSSMMRIDTTLPHRDKITIITHKMRPHIQSSCPPLMITKDMYFVLLTHTKIATRRMWENRPGIHEAHVRAAHMGQLVRVWSRPDAGSLYGKLVGHVRYTHTFDQRLDQMTLFDVALEGFPTWSVADFLASKFPGEPLSTVVHVFMFMFYPKRARAPA